MNIPFLVSFIFINSKFHDWIVLLSNSFSECMKMTLNKYICEIPNALYIPLMCIGKDSTWTSEVYSR